jgi:rod shape-determining protein MreD
VTGRRLLLGAVTVLSALLLQTTVLARLPLPGGVPDLLLVVVVAFALVEGPLLGTVTGFVTGLLADLGADHELGRAALVYALVGYVTGRLHDERPRSVLVPPLAVAGAAAAAVTVYALEGLLLGDPRIRWSAYWPALAGTTAYSVLLTPLVVPLVGDLVRRLDPDAFPSARGRR